MGLRGTGAKKKKLIKATRFLVQTICLET